MADTGNDPPIIRVVKKGGHGGHHGGAWKVAFADFVTAMMALFIVLWILGQSEDVKRGVGGYFRDPTGKALLGPGKEVSQGKDRLLGPRMVAVPTIFKRYVANQKDLEKSAERLKEMLKKNDGLKELGDQISIEVTPEGLRVEINDTDKSAIFELGSSRLNSNLIRALEVLAGEYGKMRTPVIIEGHTDSKPYGAGSRMSNWELSTQRANEARRVLEGSGLHPDMVFMVRGYADRKPRTENPEDPQNRRISMLLLSSQGLEMNLGTLAEDDAKTPAIPGIEASSDLPSGRPAPEPSHESIATREGH